MTTSVQKVIISNHSALTVKYGAAFAGEIEPAIQALIAADAKRGINTITVYLDDALAMKGVGGKSVSSASDAGENKAAVDAICNHYQPDYAVLLGAQDIIPHQDLINPAYTANDPNGDPDQLVPSDLPYACPGGYSREVQEFLNPVRVVGRLPDITNVANAAALVKALRTAAGFKSRPAEIYRQYLGVSAGVWKGSTQLSLKAAFGNSADLQVVPPKTYRWGAAQLRRPSHFFNCHGATVSPKYYGQPASGASSYPPAHDAAYIAGKIVEGTVAAAECCYGAELYDPALANNRYGIPNQYFLDGAYGFFGSTTIAYGPDTTNDWADVLCRDFFDGILGGASVGRAVLQARQNYIAARSHLSPLDMKTLAQFYLLGDPSVTPVAGTSPAPHVMMIKGAKLVPSSPGESAAVARAARRAMLAQDGLVLAASVGLPMELREPTAQIKRLLQASLAKLGVSKASFITTSIKSPLEGGGVMGVAAMKVGLRLPLATHLAIGRLPTPTHITTPRLAGVELVEYDGTVLQKQFHSR